MKEFLMSLFLFVAIVNANGQNKSVRRGDSITIAVEPDYNKVSGLHKTFFGKGYRKLWATPVTIRVIKLSSEKGGLTPFEKGGGLQTKSLKLKDKNGRDWALRSIQKYPEKGLPVKLRGTIAKDILQDQVITGHPFAALTVPVFAKALGLYHSNPEVVYLADDPALGEFRKDFANTVLLLEAKDPDGIDRSYKTEEVQKELEADHDTKVNQKLLLRGRLLDHIIGDWDRHEGNWNWAKIKVGDDVVFNPIAKDRDKVFYSTSGVLPSLLAMDKLKSNLQPFKGKIRRVSQYNFNNRTFDRYFLNELNEADWREEINFVRTKLTDQVIEDAIGKLPPPIYALSAKKLIATVKERRDRLEKFAIEYYTALAKDVDLPATRKNDYIQVNTLEGGAISVNINNGKGGKKQDVVFERTFKPSETREVRLYGLTGKDNFYITGSHKSPIKIRMIGGSGNDTFIIDSTQHNRKKIYIYDSLGDKNVLPPPQYARLRLRSDSAVNYFDRKSFRYDKQNPIASLFFSRDQGVLFGIGYRYEKQGFRKEPFAENHLLAAGYSTSRQSFGFIYSGYFTKLLKKNDLGINIVSRGPKNVSNFFGIGNETQFVNEGHQKIDYYRNRFDLVTADIRLLRQVANGVTISGGIAGTWYGSTTKNNDTRFFKEYNDTRPDQRVFENRVYGGLVAGAIFDTRNDQRLPTSGIYWTTQLAAMQQANSARDGYGSALSEFNIYLPFFNNKNVVLANRLGLGTTTGKPVFFQQMQLGGGDNLRGFHNSRFTGKSMLYHNIEVRAKLFDFNSYLFPGTVGLIGFNDIGRVWVPGENSNKWHQGVGGGFYLVPAELILIQAIAGKSKEGIYPYVSIGFSF